MTLADDQLIRHILSHPDPPPNRSIYVNRNLRMETVSYVGFDLDWTLADYHRLPLEELTFRETIDRLTGQFGYPDKIRRVEFRPNFSHRGLLVDKVAGTILKMDRHRYVGLAFLGHHELDKNERMSIYRQKRIDLTRERFYRVDTLFEIPEVNVFSEIVELHRQKIIEIPSFEQLFRDIRSAIDSLHADTTLKQVILSDPGRFVKIDGEIPLTIQRLANQGERKIFLLTNSEWYYTDGICRYLFEGALPGLTDWRELFDLIVVQAKKPLFFRDEQRPFIEIDSDGAELAPHLTPFWGGIFKAGCRDGLMSLFGKLGENVLYIGDHIYGDIRWTRLSSSWRTALILNELEGELEALENEEDSFEKLQELKARIRRLGHQIDNLRDLLRLYQRVEYNDDRIASDFAGAVAEKSAVLDKMTAEHGELRQVAAQLQAEISCRFNPTWGSIFRQGNSKSLFGEQVDDFACLYTSRVTNFAYYGSRHYFRVTNDYLRHEMDPED